MNMIASGTAEDWALIAAVILILRGFWVMLSWTFTLIDRAWEKRRATELSLERQEARVRGDGSNF